MDTTCYWVYILHCINDTYYTGYTVNLAHRYQAHLDGTSKCKYTRSFKPVGFAQCWQVPESKILAMQVERYIKKLSRAEKQHIILNPHTLAELFPITPISKKELNI